MNTDLKIKDKYIDNGKLAFKKINSHINRFEDLQQKMTAYLYELLATEPPKFFKTNHEKWEHTVSLTSETLDKLHTDLLDLYSCYEILDGIIQ